MGEIIFLDIDGVLNGHEMFGPARSSWIRPDLVDRLNVILHEFQDANLVISSAWRYMVHGGAMTLAGFEYMLRTHRIACNGRVEGVTPSDEEIEGRGRQIRAWRNEYGNGRPYVVIDDLDLGITGEGLHLVQTDGSLGLTDEDVQRAVTLLRGQRDDTLEPDWARAWDQAAEAIHEQA